MTQVIYELKKPFEYATKGEKVSANFIELTGPTFRQLDKVAPIKQAFMTAITDMSSVAKNASESTSEEPGTITGAMAVQVLYASKQDVSKVILHAEQLFKSGAAMVNGEEKLTTPLMEQMSGDDFEGLLGEYIANFILPSLEGGR